MKEEIIKFLTSHGFEQPPGRDCYQFRIGGIIEIDGRIIENLTTLDELKIVLGRKAQNLVVTIDNILRDGILK